MEPPIEQRVIAPTIEQFHSNSYLSITAPLPFALPENPSRGRSCDPKAQNTTVQRSFPVSSKSAFDLQQEVITAWTLLTGKYLATTEFDIILSRKADSNIDTHAIVSIDLEETTSVADLKDRIVRLYARTLEEPSPSHDSALEPSRSSLLIFAHDLTAVSSASSFPLVVRFAPSVDEVILNLSYDSSYISELELYRLATVLEKILRETSSVQGTLISQVQLLTTSDQDQINMWNNVEPEVVDRCIHDVISDRAEYDPDAPAIHSWDGRLSYGDLERESEFLAQMLIDCGVQIEDVIPICLDKSRWTIVSMIAVLKVGAAFLLLDSEHPTGRLVQLARNVSGKILLTSEQHESRFGELDARVVRVPLTTSTRSRYTLTILPTVSSRNLALVIYTSGSTGEPKGILLEHFSICTSLRHHAERFGFNPSSRVFQFASYSFDAAYGEILCTLMSGGCICVPSKGQRLDGLADAIDYFRADIAHLTPTVLRLLSPEQVPTLKKPILGGEPVTKDIIDTWASRVNLINMYGPAECSVGCVSKTDYNIIEPPSLIGRAMGCRTWIVACDDHNKLAPIGAVGELLIEGPGVARGYASPRDGTESPFCTPAFIKPGNGNIPARCYRTGDLARYFPDGELQFVGRTDGQLKIRGQRVELAEVEHTMKQFLPTGSDAIVEVVRRHNRGSPTLVVFLLCNQDLHDSVPMDVVYSSRNAHGLPSLIEKLIESVNAVLPTYLIPEWFIRISAIPMTVSKKIDRRGLRVKGSQLLGDHISRHSLKTSNDMIAVTDEQRLLRTAWSNVLEVSELEISDDSHFFDLGGDSVSAMRLSGLMRSHDLSHQVPGFGDWRVARHLELLRSPW
jgi:amino acid adenylation domain-containing protein